MNVDLKGKSRGVTVNSADVLFLEPVHKAIYDRISRCDWLLRGEAKPCRFSSFVSKPDEIFVSGDYSAATDNLSLEIAELLLVSIFSRCRSVPVKLQVECLRSLRANVWYDNCNRPFVQTRGQLMGSFLSFPLLCLQNYCAFKFVVHRPVPVKINGDDIVFRGTPEERDRWMEFCPSVGLFVCPGKTMIHRRYFSLNSTFFKARRSDVKLVPVVRLATLSEPPSSPCALAGGFYSFRKGWTGEGRKVVDAVYLSRRSAAIKKSGRSLRRLGIKADPWSMQSSGLWRRELWFQDVPEARLPPHPGKIKWAPLPEGWERVPLSSKPARRRRQLSVQDRFWESVTEGCWRGAVDKNVQLRCHWDEAARTGHHGSYLEFKARARRWGSSMLMRRAFGYGFRLKYPDRPFSQDNPQVICGVNPFELKMKEQLRRWLFEPSAGGRRLVWAPREPESRGVAFVSAGFALC